jgi:pimeloyl-ACP methyl ester carboxylesterase
MGEELVEFEVDGSKLSATVQGHGRDILYLSAGLWFADDSAFAQRLAQYGRVIAPTAPGFGPGAVNRRWNQVDDLAYLYLDLIDRIKLSNVILVGASFGGWIAAQMAIKSCAAVSSISLIDPLGVKVSDRFTRDIADLFGLPDPELRARAYVDPSIFEADLKKISDEELGRRMRSREALARYGWAPFMHDPKLLSRLRRICAPTQFIWGAQDQIVSPDYGRAYASHVPGAIFTQIEKAAHAPQVEQPQAVLDAILSFADAHPGTR